jgi:hypothetical protein
MSRTERFFKTAWFSKAAIVSWLSYTLRNAIRT